MNEILLVSSTILTIFLPIPAFFLNLILFIFSKKYKFGYGILLACSLAMITCAWNPPHTADLYRWHNTGASLKNSNLEALLRLIGNDADPLKYGILYVISQFGSVNMLQFIITFVSYLIIFWILSDYCSKKTIKTFPFAMAAFFVLSSFRFLYAASALWYSLALVIFALGVYLMAEKETKWLHWILFVTALLTHTGTVVLFIPLFLKKVVKNPNRRLLIYIMAVGVVLLIGPVLTWAHSAFSSSVINNVYSMYRAYFIGNDNWGNLHSGWNLGTAIFKMSTSLLLLLMIRADNEVKEYSLKFLSVLVLLTILTSATIFIRYAGYTALLVAPDLMDFLNTSKAKYSQILFVPILLCCISISTIQQLSQLSSSGILRDAKDESRTNILYMVDRD